ALNNATLNGNSVDGTGTVINGTITADTTSRVNGSASGNGDGIHINGTVNGGRIDGQATTGDGIYIADGTHISGSVVNGSSTSGTGVRTDGEVRVTGGASLSGNSGSGSGLDISGSLIHDPDSVIHADTISGGGSIRESLSAENQSAVINNVRRHGTVNAYTDEDISRQGGEPPAIFRGYRFASEPVSVQVCNESGCTDVAMEDRLSAYDQPDTLRLVWHLKDGTVVTCSPQGGCSQNADKP
ncbi:hypothetical protein HED96_004897, partial [Salmonella enterica]|nr:hypothetical protein [Salmonella enterica]